MSAVLNVEQMYAADRWAMSRGTSGVALMEAAGRACTDAILERVQKTSVSVLCGPGNNGGDGFVVARLLRDHGWNVSLFLLGERSSLQGDAAHMAHKWNGPVHPLTEDAAHGAGLIVDALFGAGLARDITGTAITFFRKKPAHLLFPGRALCGEIIVADIGIGDSVLSELDVRLHENNPALWRESLPSAGAAAHKYTKGHVLVVSGGATATGAARLGARAALRMGAGLVSVVSPPSALQVNASHLTAIMLLRFEGAEGLATLLEDKRRNAVLVGPGNGVGAQTRANVEAIMTSGAACVIDADAITSFEQGPRDLFVAIGNYFAGPTVLTPHEGEFKRLFPDLEGSKLARALAAAKRAGAIVLLKGPDTIVAAPDGRAIVNANAGPELGTAGSGDVLAGMIAGLLAQHTPAFEAAAAAAWMHGRAGTLFGRGLIAEDLPELLPQVLNEVFR